MKHVVFLAGATTIAVVVAVGGLRLEENTTTSTDVPDYGALNLKWFGKTIWQGYI